MIRRVAFVFFLVAVSTASLFAQGKVTAKKPAVPQAPAVVVTQLDDAGLIKTLKPGTKPLLVNFWATWCDPCREEFPDLVKIDTQYKDRVDFITVTLDDPGDIKTAVPKFLSEMKATMPAYLLVSADESVIIPKIAKDWTGGLPFTILYNANGDVAYFRQGKVDVPALMSEIDKLVAASNPSN